MFPTPNYVWKCEKCKKEIINYFDEKFHQPPKCPDCGGKMSGGAVIHRGPFPENPFKK